MSYMKRTSAFQWAGKAITFNNGSAMPIEIDAKRVMNKYQVHNDEVYERRLVYRVILGDVEDPEIYAARPLLDWRDSEHGQWIIKHGLDPTYHIVADYVHYGYVVNVTAHITPKRWTEYCLKFDKYVF